MVAGAFDVHEVTMFTEKRHGMMKLFFNNLEEYTTAHNRGAGGQKGHSSSHHSTDEGPSEQQQQQHVKPFFSHLNQIQVRLQFLIGIFDTRVTPVDFRLSKDQINSLWKCLASDPVVSDEFFQWLHAQIHSKEQHAIAVEGFKVEHSYDVIHFHKWHVC